MKEKMKNKFAFELPDFELDADDVDKIWFNSQVIDVGSKMNDVICRRFGFLHKSTMHVDYKNEQTKFIKSTQSRKVTGYQIYLHCNCAIKYRLSIFTKEIKENSSLTIKVFRCDAGICECMNLPPSVREVRGEARKELKEKLVAKTGGQLRAEAILAADEEVSLGGYLQDILPINVVDVIRHEMREEKRMDTDHIVDLQRRAEAGKIKDLIDLRTFPKFAATFITSGSLKLLSDVSKKKEVTLLLVATGGLTRKVSESSSSNFHHVLLLPLEKPNTEMTSSQTTAECYLVPVAEMITNDSTGFSISQFLRLVRHRLKNETGGEQLCTFIGTGFSWPNFYAILDLNNWTMKEFLSVCYNIFEGGKIDEKFQNATIPVSCFSHMSKCIKDDINKSFDNRTDRLFTARLVGQIANIFETNELDDYIKNVLTIISSQHENAAFKKAFKKLKSFHGFSERCDEQEELLSRNEYNFVDEKAIYRDSRFYQRYNTFVIELAGQRKGSTNKFYREKFLKALLSKYLAYLPLWTLFLGRIRNKDFIRGNNARVERHFQGLKEEIRTSTLELRHIGLVHCSDYAEFVEQRNARTVKEARLAVPGRKKSKVNSLRNPENLKEKWGKGRKSKTRKSTTFLDESATNEAFLSIFS